MMSDEWSQYIVEEKPKGWDQYIVDKIDTHTAEEIPVIRAAPEPSLIDTIKDYLGIKPPETTPLELEAVETGKTPYQIREEVFETARLEEARRVVGKGLAGLTGGVSDLIRGYEEQPETTPGAILGAGAELAGFLLGPLKVAKGMTGTRLIPTGTGLKGVAQVLAQGGATLGIASGISSIIPAFLENEKFTDMGVDVLEHAKIGAIVGAAFPLTGIIPTKPVRLAVGLAVMDKIRSGMGQWFTIDDVYEGLKEGTIDRKELAERAFGYLMDLYFISHVPSMGKQLKQLDYNAMMREIDKINPVEIEKALVELGKHGIMRPSGKEDMISEADIIQEFGSKDAFDRAYKVTVPDGGDQAQIVEKTYNEADIELANLRKTKLRDIKKILATATVDISANIKKELLKEGDLGKEATIRHDLIRGASSRADMMIQQASKEIYEGLNKSEEILLNRIIQSRRIIAIDKYKEGIKHPGGLTGADHQIYLDSIPKEVFEKLNPRADRYFAEMQTQLTQMKDEGLITEEAFAALSKAGDYSPRRFIQYLDPERTFTFGAKKITVTNSGIKRLEEGSYRNLENNSRLLLSQVVTRTQARIFRNKANQALYELAKQLPNNQIVRLAKRLKPTEEKPFKARFEKTPAGFEKISVMVEGKLHEMIMPQNLAKEWIVNDPAINTQLANIIGWISGSKILKPMATGINPEFALTNMPRDIAHAWATTHEYSPHLPLAAMQMAKDFAKTAGDAIFRKGSYIDYINEGGGMSFLTHQGRITKSKGIVGTAQDILGYAGETSEIWTRLALRNRAMRNGKISHEATWIARNYIDFSQGGWFIKGIDTAIPYLNAGVQGTRGIIRAAKESPAEFIYKMGQLGVLATGLYLANKINNPECWEQIPAREKVNNWIITTPFYYLDEAGDRRYLYFTIAKDQGQRIMATIFESLMGKYLGEEIDEDQAVQAALDFIPIIPTQAMPPSFEAMMGYYANKDFWRNEDIWRGPQVISSEEYTVYTHPAWKEVGGITGLSPERLRYALQQYFTYGNVYTSIVGAGMSTILNELPEETRDQAMTDILKQSPFLRRVLKPTDPYTKFEKEIEKTKIEENTRRYKQSRELDQMAEKYYSTQTPEGLNEIRTFINQQPWQDRQGLVRRFDRYGKLYQIPDRRWWLNLGELPPEAGAIMFWARWEQANEEEKKRLEKFLKQVPGIASARFLIKVRELQKLSK